MKSWISTAAVAMLLAVPAWAHGPASGHNHTHSPHAHESQSAASGKVQLDAHTQQDIERHQGMARAHEQAAQCLAAGKPYEDCQKQLQTACKGLALGKNCGMRHSH